MQDATSQPLRSETWLRGFNDANNYRHYSLVARCEAQASEYRNGYFAGLAFRNDGILPR